jgi:hypothetical protein
MQSFFKWRKQNMHRELYYLHPEWLWDLWDILQRYSPATIVGHVPTTGFIGEFFVKRQLLEFKRKFQTTSGSENKLIMILMNPI